MSSRGQLFIAATERARAAYLRRLSSLTRMRLSSRSSSTPSVTRRRAGGCSFLAADSKPKRTSTSRAASK
eukprot:5081237-Prymnesium_polylepis.1